MVWLCRAQQDSAARFPICSTKRTWPNLKKSEEIMGKNYSLKKWNLCEGTVHVCFCVHAYTGEGFGPVA